MTTKATERAPRPRDAESTRADLLTAAKRRFTMLGYDRTTSRDIAADAGANVSLINRYFGSKEGLFQAVVEQTATTLADLSAGTIPELVERMVDGLDAGSWPEYGNEHPLLLLLHGIGSDRRTAELRRVVLRSVISSMTELMQDGDAEDRALRAGVLLAVFTGILVLAEAVPDSGIVTADPRALRAVLLRAADAIGHPGRP